MSNEPQSQFLLYQTEDGRTRIQCRFENEMLWLTQKLMAELFQIGVNTVNHHLKEIFAEVELRAEATIRRYRIVQTEGSRKIRREVEHYNLAAILAVGFRAYARDIGQAIVEKQRWDGWGEAVVETLERDLRTAFPGTSGFSGRNLRDMKRLFIVYSEKTGTHAETRREKP